MDTVSSIHLSPNLQQIKCYYLHCIANEKVFYETEDESNVGYIERG